jgi:hypothetical protein
MSNLTAAPDLSRSLSARLSLQEMGSNGRAHNRHLESRAPGCQRPIFLNQPCLRRTLSLLVVCCCRFGFRLSFHDQANATTQNVIPFPVSARQRAHRSRCDCIDAKIQVLAPCSSAFRLRFHGFMTSSRSAPSLHRCYHPQQALCP